MSSFVGCEQGKAIMEEHDKKIFVSYFYLVSLSFASFG
jgi:hypothetical protein